MSKRRLGIVGLGMALKPHLESLKELSDRVEIAAVASRDQERADAYARAHGIARAYGSYDALLADPELEAIYISLPNSLHVDWSVRALDAG